MCSSVKRDNKKFISKKNIDFSDKLEIKIALRRCNTATNVHTAATMNRINVTNTTNAVKLITSLQLVNKSNFFDLE